ncbi:ESX-1 secretion system protein eccB1 [Corynebacterium bovis DSM 20582 = CIP 54.80]|nr:ESX-1 secretion system protein eccB1 [Corynebacterium bovis DSM 20582 = CIP 54.80]
MRTTALQVSGHAFLVRMCERALVLGDGGMSGEPLRAQRRAVFVGVLLTALVAGVAAALAVMRPQPSIEDAGIVVDDAGGVYVRVDDTFHPVTNVASARGSSSAAPIPWCARPRRSCAGTRRGHRSASRSHPSSHRRNGRRGTCVRRPGGTPGPTPGTSRSSPGRRSRRRGRSSPRPRGNPPRRAGERRPPGSSPTARGRGSTPARRGPSGSVPCPLTLSSSTPSPAGRTSSCPAGRRGSPPPSTCRAASSGPVAGCFSWSRAGSVRCTGPSRPSPVRSPVSTRSTPPSPRSWRSRRRRRCPGFPPTTWSGRIRGVSASAGTRPTATAPPESWWQTVPV